MSELYFYAEQASSNRVGSANPALTGGNPPPSSGDGINWPYDPNGNTPNFQINWNDPNLLKEIEQTYEKLVNWLQQNPGCYNGYVMLLQMTTDIGMHMQKLPSDEQAQLAKFLSTQLSAPSGSGTQTLFSLMISEMAKAAAVQQPSESAGQQAATNFLQSLMNATSGLQKFGYPFSEIYQDASANMKTIAEWCQSHFVSIYAPPRDHSSIWTYDGQEPILSFSDFANTASCTMGTLLTNPKSTAGNVIDSYYQAQIFQLVAEFKGNPWALLVALMNLMNQRDQDRGVAVNGYGNNLDTIKQANGLVEKLLGDISGTTPNADDFFKTLGQLNTLVTQNPALSSLVDQLKSDVQTINGQTYTSPGDASWAVSAGYYNFPPNTLIEYNKQTISVSGEIYLSGGNVVLLNIGQTYTFGQLAAMGATSIIQKQMGSWSTTIMSNFENGVSSIQTLLNGASPAIQQEIQSDTQTMQATENFEKESFASITNVNQQIMKLVQQVMG